MNIEDHFPFPSFRPNQLRILKEIEKSFDNENEVIILEGPTGFGKSPVNICLGKYYKPAFYTTPQKTLVKQIARDFGPRELAIDGGTGKIIALLGRKNYICRASGKPSDICPIRDNPQTPCYDTPRCTYSHQKSEAMDSDIAIITFAMLILNSYNGSFDKRNLLIIDECHSLESQVASMFAGFRISPYTLPNTHAKEMWLEINAILPKSKIFEDYIPFFKQLRPIISKYYPTCKNGRERDKLSDLERKIDYMLYEVLEEEKPWVVNILYNKTFHHEGYAREFKPIFIGNFLKRKVWNQGNKIILSSATIPFRNKLQNWLNRIGLGNKNFSFHSVPMTFPKENRPIYLDCMKGKMTKNNENENWNENIQTIKEIIKENIGTKGVIHTHSYDRATRISKDLKNFSIFLHEKEKIDGDVIEEWIKSRKQILISPSIKEGVDLKGDLCRFQIILKIPYPSIADARVKYLLMEKKQWTWYFQETAKDIIQMYGRAIRSEDDHAKLYIIDGSFNDVHKKTKFPEWFEEALIY